MKNLHWSTVNPFDVEKTVWKTVNEDSVMISAKELEDKFCWKEIESKSNEETKAVEVKQPETVSVLDPKRSYNVEIFLGRLKMDNWDVRNAMMEMNEQVLKIDVLNKMINFVPTPEELEAIKQQEGVAHLAAPDMYFKIIGSVDSNPKQRLELWVFKLSFDDAVKAERDKIQVVQDTVQNIRRSNHFQKLLTYILAIGNYMNGGTKNGGAFGFKLGSLIQLSRSKTVDNKQSLLQYLYEWLEVHDNSVLDFTNELACLEDASAVDMSTLRENVTSIGSRLKAIQDRLKQKPTSTDQFLNVMTPFYTSASNTFEHLSTSFQTLQKDLKSLGYNFFFFHSVSKKKK
ncbi:protein diaphanous like protein [Reticulomyxa filosa]|uniref:Protein diaphanous like protein n=1 Tax=Reticulomyxa filosa TaxID=46433 RepID=X6NDH9_RETFI|nr:protein diaphanous like protein [Reticulomyxa filosa]|eukprot:ETO24056.1 protein diaphanous like protein [Reticulomyxa filosa]